MSVVPPSLLSLTGLTAEDLAARLSMDVTDDSDGLDRALTAACNDVEQLVYTYTDSASVPQGLKVALLDIAATRYERTTLSTTEAIGSVRNDYSNEYEQMLQRIAPYRDFGMYCDAS
jgi:hypothetical protein